jgi:hypothetical protein
MPTLMRESSHVEIQIHGSAIGAGIRHFYP